MIISNAVIFAFFIFQNQTRTAHQTIGGYHIKFLGAFWSVSPASRIFDWRVSLFKQVVDNVGYPLPNPTFGGKNLEIVNRIVSSMTQPAPVLVVAAGLNCTSLKVSLATVIFSPSILATPEFTARKSFWTRANCLIFANM